MNSTEIKWNDKRKKKKKICAMNLIASVSVFIPPHSFLSLPSLFYLVLGNDYTLTITLKVLLFVSGRCLASLHACVSHYKIACNSVRKEKKSALRLH